MTSTKSHPWNPVRAGGPFHNAWDQPPVRTRARWREAGPEEDRRWTAAFGEPRSLMRGSP
jgi:hypothetical protein